MSSRGARLYVPQDLNLYTRKILNRMNRITSGEPRVTSGPYFVLPAGFGAASVVTVRA